MSCISKVEVPVFGFDALTLGAVRGADMEALRDVKGARKPKRSTRSREPRWGGHERRRKPAGARGINLGRTAQADASRGGRKQAPDGPARARRTATLSASERGLSSCGRSWRRSRT
jgi:hypothetical protein